MFKKLFSGVCALALAGSTCFGVLASAAIAEEAQGKPAPDSPEEHLKMPHYFDSISTQWGQYNDTEGGNQNEVTARETVNIDAQLVDDNTAVQWSINFNKGKGIWNHPKMAIGFPKELELPETFTFTHDSRDGSTEPTTQTFSFEEWTTNKETDGTIFRDNDQAELNKALNYYFRGQRNEAADIIPDENSLIQPAPTKDELENVQALIEFKGYGGYKRPDSYTVVFKTKLKDPSNLSATLFAGLKTREGEGGLNLFRRYYYRYEQATIKRIEMPEVVYCLNHTHANPPLKGFGDPALEFGRTDYIDPKVPTPAFNGGSKELVEWLLYLGYPFDGANLAQEIADDYRHVTTDATYADWGDIGALNDYYGATQNAIWHFTDGSSLDDIDHTYYVGNEKHEIKRPIAAKLVEKAREYYQKYGTLTDYLEKSNVPEAKAYKAFYYQNNELRRELGSDKPYQNFVGLRKANSEPVFPVKGDIEVSKIDADKNPLPGAEFDLYEGTLFTNKEVKDSGKAPIRKGIKANELGKFTLGDLKTNTAYTLVESKTPAGFEAGDPTIFRLERVYNVFSDAGFDKKGWASFLHRAEEGSDGYRLAINKLDVDGIEKGYRRWVPSEDIQFHLKDGVVSGQAAFNIQNHKGIDAEISKVIYGSETALSGAHLKLVEGQPESDIVLKEWNSAEKPESVKIAANKIYTVVETSAPAGFEIAKPVSFSAIPDKDGKIEYWLLDNAMNRVAKNPQGNKFFVEDRRTGERVIKTTVRSGTGQATSAKPLSISMYQDVFDREHKVWTQERAKDINLIDEVEYLGLTKGADYTLTTEVVEVTDDNQLGKVIFTKDQDFSAENSDGVVVVALQNVAPEDGKRYVVTETFTSKAPIDGDTQVLAHRSASATEQTFVVANKSDKPTISTVAHWGKDLSASVTKALEITEDKLDANKLSDLVKYSGLIPNEPYVLTTTLNKVNGSSTEEVYKTQSEFTPDSSAGIHEVKLQDPAVVKALKDGVKERFVIFQKLESKNPVTGDNKSEKQVVSHESATNLAESILVKVKPAVPGDEVPFVPSNDENAHGATLRTTADVAGNKASAEKELEVENFKEGSTITVTDHIDYEGLKAGELYHFTGTLVRVTDNGVVKVNVAGSEDGSVHKDFTPENPKGTLELEFKDVPGLKAGEKYVVFERAESDKPVSFEDGKPAEKHVLVHENKDDKAQSVILVAEKPSKPGDEVPFVPSNDENAHGAVLRTTADVAGNKASAEKELEVENFKEGSTITVTDHIDYEGLKAGELYHFTGTLVRVTDNGVVKVNVAGSEDGSVHKDFTPENPKGTLELEFKDVPGLKAGEKYVVFERAESDKPVSFEDGKPAEKHVLVHENKDDKAQSVILVAEKPSKPGDEGDKPGTGGDGDKPGTGGDGDKPNTGGDKPGKPGEGTDGGDKPGKPEDGTEGDKPNKPGDGGETPEVPFVPSTDEKSHGATLRTTAEVAGKKASEAQELSVNYKPTDKITVTDHIDFEGLKPGELYHFTGTLVRVDAQGHIFKVQLPGTPDGSVHKDFTPENPKGTLELEFKDVPGLKAGEKYVVFERAESDKPVSFEDGKPAEKHVLVHENKDDKAQSVILVAEKPSKPGDEGDKPGTSGDGDKPGTGGDGDKPNTGGDKPGKPGEGTDGGDKPGKPGDGTEGDKPNKPGDGGNTPGGTDGGTKPGNEGNKPSKPGEDTDSETPGGTGGGFKPGKPGQGGQGDKPGAGGETPGKPGTGNEGNTPGRPGGENPGSGNNGGNGGNGHSNHNGAGRVVPGDGAHGAGLPKTGDAAEPFALVAGMIAAAGVLFGARRKSKEQ